MTPAAISAEALYTRLGTDIYGSDLDTRATEVVEYRKLQTAISACMKLRHVPYIPPPFESSVIPGIKRTAPNLSYPLAYDDPVGASHIGFQYDLRYSSAAKWQVEHGYKSFDDQPVDAALARIRAPAGRTQYVNAIYTCSSRNQMADLSPYSYGVGAAVLSRLKKVVGDAARRGDVVRALRRYPGCMAQAGFKASDLRMATTLVVARYQSVLAEDGIFAPQRKSPSWQSAVRFERSVAVADARCRWSAHTLVYAQLLQPLTAFVKANSRQLNTLASQYTALRRKASG